MIHSARPTVSPRANILFTWNLFCFETWGRTNGWTTCAKTMITIGRDCGSASWINSFVLFISYLILFQQPSASKAGQDNPDFSEDIAHTTSLQDNSHDVSQEFVSDFNQQQLDKDQPVIEKPKKKKKDKNKDKHKAVSCEDLQVGQCFELKLSWIF